MCALDSYSVLHSGTSIDVGTWYGHGWWLTHQGAGCMEQILSTTILAFTWLPVLFSLIIVAADFDITKTISPVWKGQPQIDMAHRVNQSWTHKTGFKTKLYLPVLFTRCTKRVDSVWCLPHRSAKSGEVRNHTLHTRVRVRAQTRAHTCNQSLII